MSYTTYVSDFGVHKFPNEMLAAPEDANSHWLQQSPEVMTSIIEKWALRDWQNGFPDNDDKQQSLNQTILDALSEKYGANFAGYRISSSGFAFDKFEVCISNIDHAALLLKLKFGGA